MPHLVTNNLQRARILAGDHVEKQKQDILDYIEQEKSHVIYIEDKLVNPTDSTKQLGHILLSSIFEKKLATVLPSSITFIENPYRPGFSAVVRICPKYDTNFGQYETLSPYERGVMPEHSILQLVEEEIPDPQIVARRKSLERKDIPKHEYVPGEGFKFEGDVRPGFIKVKKLGHEIKRGWRTVLIKLILAKVLSVYDAERLFGQDTTTNWAYHTGRKAHIDVPW